MRYHYFFNTNPKNELGEWYLPPGFLSAKDSEEEEELNSISECEELEQDLDVIKGRLLRNKKNLQIPPKALSKQKKGLVFDDILDEDQLPLMAKKRTKQEALIKEKFLPEILKEANEIYHLRNLKNEFNNWKNCKSQPKLNFKEFLKAENQESLSIEAGRKQIKASRRHISLILANSLHCLNTLVIFQSTLVRH